MLALCLPWHGRAPKALPLSVAETDQGLIGPHLSYEQNIPQQLNRGAAATPPAEWTQCGASAGLTWRGSLTNVGPRYEEATV